MSQPSTCGIMGADTEAKANEVIRYKRETKGERNWAFVKCPVCAKFHAYNGDRYSEADYLEGLISGKHARKLAEYNERCASLMAPEKAASKECVKVGYPSQAIAEQTLALCIAKGREEKNVYECDICPEKWHLTSQDQDVHRYVMVKEWTNSKGIKWSLHHDYVSRNRQAEILIGLSLCRSQHNQPSLYTRLGIEMEDYTNLIDAIIEGTLPVGGLVD